jgi:hypothetical protein
MKACRAMSALGAKLPFGLLVQTAVSFLSLFSVRQLRKGGLGFLHTQAGRLGNAGPFLGPVQANIVSYLNLGVGACIGRNFLVFLGSALAWPAAARGVAGADSGSWVHPRRLADASAHRVAETCFTRRTS